MSSSSSTIHPHDPKGVFPTLNSESTFWYFSHCDLLKFILIDFVTWTKEITGHPYLIKTEDLCCCGCVLCVVVLGHSPRGPRKAHASQPQDVQPEPGWGAQTTVRRWDVTWRTCRVWASTGVERGAGSVSEKRLQLSTGRGPSCMWIICGNGEDWLLLQMSWECDLNQHMESWRHNPEGTVAMWSILGQHYENPCRLQDMAIWEEVQQTGGIHQHLNAVRTNCFTVSFKHMCPLEINISTLDRGKRFRVQYSFTGMQLRNHEVLLLYIN